MTNMNDNIKDENFYVEKYQDNSLINFNEIDEDLWTNFVVYYKKVHNLDLPMKLSDLRALNDLALNNVFDDYVSTSLQLIIMNIMNIFYKSIKKFEKSMDNLDEKSTFVIMDKLSSQIKILNDLYQRIKANKQNKEDEFNFKEL